MTPTVLLLAATWAVAVATSLRTVLDRPLETRTAPVRSTRRRTRRSPVPTAGPGRLADLVDLLLVAATAGMPPGRMLEVVAKRVDPPFDGAIRTAVATLRQGGGHDRAFADAFAPAGDDGRRVAGAMAVALRDGTPLAATLTRLSDDLSRRARREAERRARRLPVQLLFPLVTCVLPAFALLTVVPLLAGSLGSLPS